MNKLLKKIITFAFLIIINMQIFGQGWQWGNPWDVYWFTDMVHSLQWLNEHPLFDPSGGGGPGVLPRVTELIIMTYNIQRCKEPEKHAAVINASNPDIVSIQEMKHQSRYDKVKQKTGLSGKFSYFPPKPPLNIRSGHATLWKTTTVGTPTCRHEIINLPQTDSYNIKKAAYTALYFRDFNFVSTHYPPKYTINKNAMSDAILNDGVSSSAVKPVYMAGDFNCNPDSEVIKKFTNPTPPNQYHTFDVLNNLAKEANGKYIDWTGPDGVGHMIDLILGNNRNSNKEILEQGIPWYDNEITDHKPYRVKIKIK